MTQESHTESANENSPPLLSERFCCLSSIEITTLPISMNQAQNASAIAGKATWVGLAELLEHYPATVDEVNSTVLALKLLYPWIPGPHINYPDGPWPSEKPRYVHKTHLTQDHANFRIALDNIAKTSRSLDESEKQYLRSILCFNSGWSATHPSHHEDSWIQCIRHRFPSIENIHPILDDMTWPEEIDRFPSGYGAGGPGYLLLANSTAFYFYYYDTEELLNAGTTLEQVYWGLREQKWRYQNPPKRRWIVEPDNGEEYDMDDYFPIWKYEWHEDGRMSNVLAFPLQHFVPHCRQWS